MQTHSRCHLKRARRRSISERRPVPTDRKQNLPADALGTTPLGIRVAPNTWMRKRGIGTVLQVAFVAAFAVAFCAFAILAPIKVRPGEPLAALVAVDALFVAIAALAMRFALRMARAGLRISPNAVCLRGVLRTHTLPLTGVEGFAPAAYPGGAARSEIGVKLVRRQGHDLRVWAMTKGAQPGRLEEAKAGLQPLCDELNRLLEETSGQGVDGAEVAQGRPITREAADRAYRTLRNYLAVSAVWFFGVAVLAAVVHFNGWPIYVGIVTAAEGIGIPLFLLIYRRELDRKVRAARQSPVESAAVRQ